MEELTASTEADGIAVQAAVKAYGDIYKELYEGINTFVVAHGYQPIGFIEGYAPHLQPESERTAFSKALKMLGLDDAAMELPTSISGQTADLKPYKQYNPFFQERRGDKTEYDIAKGFENYVYYLGNIFQTGEEVGNTAGIQQDFQITGAVVFVHHLYTALKLIVIGSQLSLLLFQLRFGVFQCLLIISDLIVQIGDLLTDRLDLIIDVGNFTRYRIYFFLRVLQLLLSRVLQFLVLLLLVFQILLLLLHLAQIIICQCLNAAAGYDRNGQHKSQDSRYDPFHPVFSDCFHSS